MATPEAQREYQRNWIARRRAIFFADKVCSRCGSDSKLELDHIDPKTKISNSIWSWSQARQSIEIAKCQILCRSCHSEKTRKNSEQVSNSLLTMGAAQEIRRLHELGVSQRAIAQLYDVNFRTISDVVRKISWNSHSPVV